MDESTRNDIIRMFYSRASHRRIAKTLAVDRKTVAKIIAEHEEARRGSPAEKRKPRKSLLDPFQDNLVQLIERYPEITAVRMLEELRRIGFTGAYTIVRDRLRQLRRRPRLLIRRFETAAGVQGQMDYSPYDIAFTAEGKRRVHAFSYILGYSRRQYVHFVEQQDFTTTIRQHVAAFTYLGGLAAECLYDNMKVVVSGHDGEQPIYNTRFLAFATYYGFRPVACRPRRPQTKGKVERQFQLLEGNLLNGRTFSSLQHLNETTAWWLAHIADVRQHQTTRRTPLELFQEELPHLLPLPEKPYDTAEVVYRTVNPEGYVGYLQNFYSVPWQRIGELLPVRITETELIVYDPDIREIARHQRLPVSPKPQHSTHPPHRPGPDLRRKQELLRQRFEQLGAEAAAFFDQLIRARRFGKDEAVRILGLLAIYHQVDLRAAIERANRYRAFSRTAVERILAASARPRSALDSVDQQARQHLDELLRQNPVPPRATSDYQQLLEDSGDDLPPGKNPSEEESQ
ncbi:MAG TPA: IS21 family transposase [Terriglobales bacterium]